MTGELSGRHALVTGASRGIGKVIAVHLAVPDDPGSLVQEAEAELGPVDVLVANAGGSPSRPQPVEEMSDSDFVAAGTIITERTGAQIPQEVQERLVGEHRCAGSGPRRTCKRRYDGLAGRSPQGHDGRHVHRDRP